MDRQEAWAELKKGAALSLAYRYSITSANPCDFMVNLLTADKIQSVPDLDPCDEKKKSQLSFKAGKATQRQQAKVSVLTETSLCHLNLPYEPKGLEVMTGSSYFQLENKY